MSDPFRFDDGQLEKLLLTLGKPKKPSWGLERMLLMTQLTAIILAGLWSLYIYLSYEREHHALTTRKEQINVAALETSQETRLKFTNIDFNATVLQSFPDESTLYRIQLAVTAENIGQSPLEVSFSLLSVYLGTLSKELAPDSLANINPPPSLFGGSSQGDVIWRLLKCQGFRYGDSKHEIDAYFSNAECDKPSVGGTLTAILKSGEYSQLSTYWIIRARSDKLAAATLDVGVDGGKGKGNCKYLTKWIFLSGAEKQNQ